MSADYYDTWLRDAAEGMREICGPARTHDDDGYAWTEILRDAARAVELARELRRAALTHRGSLWGGAPADGGDSPA